MAESERIEVEQRQGTTATEALRRQERLLDLAPVANIVRRLDGTILLWSQGAERLYGWRKEEAIGRLTHSLLRTEFPQPLEDILAKVRRGEGWSGDPRVQFHLLKNSNLQKRGGECQ